MVGFGLRAGLGFGDLGSEPIFAGRAIGGVDPEFIGDRFGDGTFLGDDWGLFEGLLLVGKELFGNFPIPFSTGGGAGGFLEPVKVPFTVGGLGVGLLRGFIDGEVGELNGFLRREGKAGGLSPFTGPGESDSFLFGEGVLRPLIGDVLTLS